MGSETVACEVPETFRKLPLAVLKVSAFRDMDVYWMPEGHEQPKLLKRGTLGISDDELSDLSRRGCHSLFVCRSEFDENLASAFGSLEEIAQSHEFPAPQRFAVLQEVVSVEIDKAFRATNCGRLLAVAEQVGTNIARLIQEESVTPLALFSLAQHDTTTFVHVTNVTAYAVLLSQVMGLDLQQQQQIAVGAILHDLGKRKVPRELLNKPGQLTARERETIQSHPTLGYIELHDRKELNHGQLMMVYQHHEWVNGRGYPVALTGEDIHPWAKLVAVVDVFDALTARRPYRQGVSATDALNELICGINTQFDSEAVKCWISLFRQ